MPIVYSGAHSITFIESKNGSVNIARSWLDWHLVPSSRPVVPPASPNISIVQIPGSNRSIDLTEALSGNITYARRTGSWEFIVDHDRWSDWVTAYKTIKSFLNGRRLYCILEDDHDVVYNGRFVLKDWKSDSDYSRITIDYSLDHEESSNSFIYNLKLTPQRITASFNSGSKVITNENTLDSLRRYTTTNITYDNGYSEDTDKYSLSGDLPSETAGDKAITVRSSEKSTINTSMTVPTQKQEVKRLVVDFRPRNKKIYSGPRAEVLNVVRKYLTVTAVWTDGKYKETDEYELSVYEGGTGSGGTPTLRVSYLNVTERFTVEVTQTVLESITAVYDYSHKVFVGDSTSSLKDYLTVTANYNSGKKETVTSYSLSGDLTTSGAKTITLTYNGKSTTFTVNVLDIVVVSITAEYDSSHTVYAGDDLNSLRSYVTVVATKNNGTTRTIGINATPSFTLSGDISSSGTKTITVSYSEKTTTFKVNVVALVVEDIAARMPPGVHTIYAGDSLDSLRPYLIVSALYNSGVNKVLEEFEYALSGDLSTRGNKTLTASFEGKSDSFTVNVVALAVTSISASYDSTHTVYAGDSLDSIKPYTTVTATYNSGSIENVTSFSLSGDISSSGTKTITASYGGRSDTFSVSVVALAVTSISASYDSTRTVYAGDSLDSLKPYTTVTATYNSGSTENVTSFSLSGNISSSGTKTITVSYGGKTTTFSVSVVALAVTSISASYDSTHTVYAGDSLDSLKPYTTVTATYNNGTTENVTSFSLSGDISTSGTKTITASYSGKTTAFDVDVIVISDLSIVYNSSDKVYFGDDLDAVKSYLVVSVVYDNGATKEVSEYELAGDTGTVGNNTFIVSYMTNEKSISINVSYRPVIDIMANVAEHTIGSDRDYGYNGITMNKIGPFDNFETFNELYYPVLYVEQASDIGSLKAEVALKTNYHRTNYVGDLVTGYNHLRNYAFYIGPDGSYINVGIYNDSDSDVTVRFKFYAYLRES